MMDSLKIFSLVIIVIVFFSHVVMGATTTKPPTTSTTTKLPPTTTPDYCEGIENPGLGEPCMYCYCNSGEYECWYSGCEQPRCVDSITKPGECCLECPNGWNCAIGGQIIPYGKSVVIPGYGECTCVTDEYLDSLSAMCVVVTPPTATTTKSPPTTTTPKPNNCEGLDEPLLTNPCWHCSCNNGRYECFENCCAPTGCVDSVMDPKNCCYVCPNGPNCLMNGIIVPEGQEVQVPGHGLCFCGTIGYGLVPEQVCYPEPPTSPASPATTTTTLPSLTTTATKAPPTTTTTTTTTTLTPTTPKTCEGVVNPSLTDPCLYCTCNDGQYECVQNCCPPVECVDSITKPGVCCPVCPNGRNCMIGGSIVPDDLMVEVPGVGLCRCGPTDGAWGPQPICIPTSPTPPTTTTTKATTTTTTVKPTTTTPAPNTCEGVVNPSLTDPCKYCTCNDGQYECLESCCPALDCVDGTYKPGVCCEFCPNGPNCWINGSIVSADRVIDIPGRVICFCVFENSRPESMCLDYPN